MKICKLGVRRGSIAIEGLKLSMLYQIIRPYLDSDLPIGWIVGGDMSNSLGTTRFGRTGWGVVGQRVWWTHCTLRSHIGVTRIVGLRWKLDLL